ncbi:hypothetical protein CXB51_001039 [Gossypium anomalum]|uniref:Uncharacterized protein n=1 Tax=Gossypium anomalum TaxID=47600 RepID=A0A8J6DBU3_9ROSI|nr:hypothetical protein CXB51_001039 [Gossypium anomalum]
MHTSTFQGYSRKLADFYSLSSLPITNSVLQESYFTHTKFSPQKHSNGHPLLPSTPALLSFIQLPSVLSLINNKLKQATVMVLIEKGNLLRAIISIAIEDGNNLQEAWEHILTCLSRIEHLQLLGEGAPTDASFLSVSNTETDDKMLKSTGLQSLKNKGTLQNLAVMAVVRGGSYDSASVEVNNSGLLNHVFAHSQRLNSEAIVAFVKALCKVSISELQSPTNARVFSLTKLVEIAHYNMNRIRLIWSRMWNVLSDFFLLVGLSENLSVAIFVMDSLQQLAMKFLEREEIANS